MIIQPYAAHKLPIHSSSPFHAESLGAAAAFGRYSLELEQLRRMTGIESRLDGVQAWVDAKPISKSWEQRVLLLWNGDCLVAAFFYRERTVCGIGTGLLRAGDAMGETLLLCAPGRQNAMLHMAVEALLDSRRRFLILLDSDFAGQALHPGVPLPFRLRVHSIPVTVHWKHELRGSFDDSIASFGRRTRRNLRHALRLVRQKEWRFEPQLSSEELAQATADLARRSTHPVSSLAYEARLKMSTTLPGFFAMGLRNAQGEWLSTLTGCRQAGGVTDVLWQHNARGIDDSLCIVLRGLLIVEEVRRGGAMLRYLGGTNPLMEHCCNPEPSAQVSVARPGLRLSLLRWLMRTSLLSAEHPLRKHIG